MTVGQAYVLRAELDGIELQRTLIAMAQVLAASVVFALTAYGVWWVLDDALGRSLRAQVVSVLGGLTAGTIVYAGLVLLMRIPEAHQILELFTARLRRRAS